MLRLIQMKHKQNLSVLNPTNILGFVFREETRSGVLLIIAAVTALVLANSAWSQVYFHFIETQFSLGTITLDIQHWVGEGLMALFFLVVVLEVKREFIDGELKTWRKASFPVIAAIGGMLAPALIYSLFNPSPPQASGWGIPIATDIAMAVGVLALLGKRIPRNLRLFLLTLAIIDDIGSIIIIALFYSQPSNVLALLGAITLSIGLFLLRTQKFWIPLFALGGIAIWYCLMQAGISGTMAGVIVAALAPLASANQKHHGLQSSEKIEDMLLPVTAFIIVPLFVFTNAGLVFADLTSIPRSGLTITLGVIGGLVIGKPLGIILATWLSTKLGLSFKPKGLKWRHIMGIGCLAGIGFTISLLITDLSFGENPPYQNAAVLGVFVASVLSAILGLFVLHTTSKQ